VLATVRGFERPLPMRFKPLLSQRLGYRFAFARLKTSYHGRAQRTTVIMFLRLWKVLDFTPDLGGIFGFSDSRLWGRVSYPSNTIIVQSRDTSGHTRDKSWIFKEHFAAPSGLHLIIYNLPCLFLMHRRNSFTGPNLHLQSILKSLSGHLVFVTHF
jgi:hypothetical protein